MLLSVFLKLLRNVVRARLFIRVVLSDASLNLRFVTAFSFSFSFFLLRFAWWLIFGYLVKILVCKTLP